MNCQYDNVLLDAQNLIVRYGHPFAELCTRTGRPSGYEYGFAKMISQLPGLYGPAKYWFCWDGEPVRAKRIAAENQIPYKANRSKKEDSWYGRVERIRRFSRNFGMSILNPSLEADELIAQLARSLTGNTLIVSADKDLHQLVTDTVQVTSKPGETILDRTAVEELWGVPVEKLSWLRALVGDGSDNMNGCTLPSKLLARLVTEADSLEMLEVFFENEDLTTHQKNKLAEHRRLFGSYYDIMSLDVDGLEKVPNHVTWSSNEDVKQFCNEFELQSLDGVWNRLWNHLPWE